MKAMKSATKTFENRGKMILVGISVVTSNAAEGNQETAKIGKVIGTFFGGNMSESIEGYKNAGTAYGVYTKYGKNKANGDYTYFIGKEVEREECETTELEKKSGLECLEIPKQTYAKFTTKSGAMPDICVNTWQEIWATNDEDLLEGYEAAIDAGQKKPRERAFIADFDVYDERMADPKNSTMDIFIGIA